MQEGSEEAFLALADGARFPSGGGGRVEQRRGGRPLLAQHAGIVKFVAAESGAGGTENALGQQHSPPVAEVPLRRLEGAFQRQQARHGVAPARGVLQDRKSTRLNSSQ